MNRRLAITIVAGAAIIIVALLVNFLIQRRVSAPPPTTPTPRPTSTPLPVPTATPVPPTPAPTSTHVPVTPAPTNTPGPTPLPVAPTPTPGPIVTNDKLGVGIYSSHVVVNVIREFRPALLLVEDPGVATAHVLRDNFPKALIVGRRFVADGDPLLANCTDPHEDHYAKGAAFADYISRWAVPLKGTVDAWVSDNEQASSSDQAALPCHAAFQTGFIERLQGHYGVAAVAGNDGAGALNPSDYPKFFAKPIGEATYFGIHAYGKPGANSLRVDPLYYALRYRLIHDALVNAGVPLPKGGFLLTETGLYQGWRGMVSDNTMAADFIWLEQQTEQDAYMRGQMIFGLGMDDRFKNFELEGTNLLQQLADFNLLHAGKV
ncbi:MAG TPA: hypothetical protein VMV93_12785 [Chloroflexota bacterium]|nr:hypothetical protein [Chloroflexota bacterium]